MPSASSCIFRYWWQHWNIVNTIWWIWWISVTYFLTGISFRLWKLVGSKQRNCNNNYTGPPCILISFCADLCNKPEPVDLEQAIHDQTNDMRQLAVQYEWKTDTAQWRHVTARPSPIASNRRSQAQHNTRTMPVWRPPTSLDRHIGLAGWCRSTLADRPIS